MAATYDTEHSRDDTDSENVVRIREEANAGNCNSTHVVPTEGSLVDLGECESPTLVGVGDVSVVVVEVVKRSLGKNQQCFLSSQRGREGCIRCRRRSCLP